MAEIKDKGMFKFAGTYEVNAATALDPRVQWDSFKDLIKKDFWPTSGETVYAYNGLIAAVGEEVWLLIDKAKFISRIHNTVGLSTLLQNVVTKEDGSTEFVYKKTKEIAEILGWKVIGMKSDVENHCLNME
jgi:hypothetical protein